MIAMAHIPRHERGVALLVVLWGCTLAAITLGALATGARVEGIQARGQYLRVVAFYAAEAGIEQAVYRLRATRSMQRWAVDGRIYRIRQGDADVSVAVTDEDGKLNLNRASPEQVAALLQAVDVASEQARQSRDAIVAWGKKDDRFSDSLLASGGFASLEELRRVPGLPGNVVDRLEPALTLWSNSAPNLAHAPPAVVAAVTGAGREASEAYVKSIRNMAPDNDALPPVPGKAGSDPPSLPTSGTVTVVSSATVMSGLTVTIHATIALKNSPGDPRAYRVLRWRESVATDGRASND